ncbi:hypothetical protein AQI88_16555 [Streptomyces cellostaticus]|uniref:LD-carboxypeptidase n=1 Tax=Streptomyces cellostaticus TaxID=67285 RepID=A0A117PWR9_9ACTN|nr:hypothetical protein AQI88_16555 [Streptomyces cellostaticus]
MVAPAAGTAALFPARLERGLRALRAVGLRPRLAGHARSRGRWTSAGVADRVADLHDAFADESSHAVLCTIGGRLSAQLLPELDFAHIAAHPKIFCGYSDITSLHTAIRSETGLITFYGPSLLGEWAEYPRPLTETVRHFLRVTGEPRAAGRIPFPHRIVRETVDWGADHRPRRAERAPTQRVIRPGRASGVLAGGCLPVLRRLVGTRWQPDFRETIAVLETPQSPYDMADAAEDLLSLSHAGVLDGARALVFGWPFRHEQLDDLEYAVRLALPRCDVPTVIGFPAGHTSPMATLPLGVRATLDGGALVLDEPAVRPRQDEPKSRPGRDQEHGW